MKSESDRVWECLGEGAMGDEERLKAIHKIVGYGIKKFCLGVVESEIPEVREWAKQWVRGGDRSEETAKKLRDSIRDTSYSPDMYANWSKRKMHISFLAVESATCVESDPRSAAQFVRNAVMIYMGNRVPKAFEKAEYKRQLRIIDNLKK